MTDTAAKTPMPATPANPEVSGTKPAGTTGNDQPKEIGGPKGPEPTRFGDWEQKGRCTDF